MSLGEQESQGGVEFIHVSIGGDAHMVFGHSAAVAEPRFTSVARLRIDFGNGHHGIAPWLSGYYFAGGLNRLTPLGGLGWYGLLLAPSTGTLGIRGGHEPREILGKTFLRLNTLGWAGVRKFWFNL